METNNASWEHVSKLTYRLKINGGWLVGARLKNDDHVDSTCSRFFSDPSHGWEL